jgi:transposase
MPQKHTEEFKIEAIKLVREQGLSVSQVAKDLGIGQSTLSKWLAAATQIPGANSLTESEKEELKRLRKENHTLRMERDLLKKATAFFSKNVI